MQIPDPLLLDTSRGDLLPQTGFNATLNAHGMYDGLRFVVRLSPQVHELIASLPNGIGFSGSGVFTAVGPQVVRLIGNGTPAAAGTRACARGPRIRFPSGP